MPGRRLIKRSRVNGRIGKDILEQQSLLKPDAGRERMGITWRKCRHTVNHTLDTIAAKARKLLEGQPWIPKAYGVLIWCALVLLVIGLFVSEDVRKIALQALWSFYVLLQFWLLCRSKTLSWKRFMGFYMAGAYVVIPLTQWTMSLVHAVAGGRTYDGWSTYIVTPIVEEALKLLPAAVYLLFSRKARSLSLTDYILMGGAAGAGFQFVEEAGRRLLARSIKYGFSIFGQTLHWEFWDWFPGYFGHVTSPIMSTGHAASTALVTLGLGIAMRLRRGIRQAGHRKWAGLAAALVPVLFYLWVTLSHMVWNSSGRAPEWMKSLHDTLGGGYWVEPFLLLLILAAVIYDYVDLNRNRGALPLLEGERSIQPFGEFVRILRTALGERGRFMQVLSFFRERRELGFQLLYGDAGNEEDIQERERSRRRLTAVLVPAALALIALVAGAALLRQGLAAGDPQACFACQFDRLQSWWDRLSGTEKLLIVGTGVALAALAVGFLPAVGYGMTLAGIAGSGHDIAATIRRPSRLLEPQVALGLATDLALSRVPLARLLPRGSGSVLRQTDELAQWVSRGARRVDDAVPSAPHGGRGASGSGRLDAERSGPQAQAAAGGGAAGTGGRSGTGGGRGSGSGGDGTGNGGAGRGHGADDGADGAGGRSGGGREGGSAGGGSGGRGDGGEGNGSSGRGKDGAEGSGSPGKSGGDSSPAGSQPGDGRPESLNSAAGKKLWAEMLGSPAAAEWADTTGGVNQGVIHHLQYTYTQPNRIPGLEARLGVQPGHFDLTPQGFENFTAQAKRVVAEGQAGVIAKSGKDVYFLEGVKGPNRGIIVIMKNGLFESMMAGKYSQFIKLIQSK